MALPGGYLLRPQRIGDMPLFTAMNNNRWTEAFHIMTDPDWNDQEVRPATPFTISHTCSEHRSISLWREWREWITGYWTTVRPGGVGRGEGRTALRVTVFVP